jgi:predicted TIM-barrel fold metal-dependent hydrolase
MKLRMALTALTLFAAGAHGPALGGAPTAAAAERSRIVPLADYHQHLVSPAGADWLYETPKAPKLSADLERLLREKAARWNDKTALAALYAEDSLIINPYSDGWIRGRDKVAEHLSTFFARPFRITPIAYAGEGSTGHLSGYFTRGDGASARHFGSFYMGLAKGQDGAWRIAVETSTFPGPPAQEPIDGEQLVRLLDAAGIQRAVVLSDAYWFDSARREPLPDAYAKVRAENDWTAREVARFPDRLVGFCSFNPLKDYALAELDRCASSRHFKGVKLHFGTSGVDLKNPQHVEKVRGVFQAANQRRMPIVVHVRENYETYGREHAEILLNQVLTAAPDIPIQIAHLWGGEAFSDSALAVYADAVSAGHPATKNLYFDVADAAAVAGGNAETLRTIVQRIRQIGLRRILYGSDAVGVGHPAPREAWAAFRTQVPFTDEELKVIANNVAPYLRSN